MTDPTESSADQSELLDVLEQIALLPIPVDEDDLALLGGRAFDLSGASTLALDFSPDDLTSDRKGIAPCLKTGNST